MAKFYYGDLHEVGSGHPSTGPVFPSRPVDPGWGIDEGGELPSPPGTPTHPIQPAPPEIPPGTVWPPLFPERPDQGLPTPPGGGHDQLKKVWAFVWIRGYGHRWVVLDISARPLPPTAGQLPTAPIPPAAQPKT